MDDLNALDLAIVEFQRRVDLVTDDDLGRPTPCEAWDVGYLIAHVVGGNRFASMVLVGESSSVAIEQIMSTPQLSDRPGHDYAQSAEEQRRLFRQPGILDRDVDHPIGSLTAGRFLRFRIFDLTIHAWDIAIALGADPTLDRQLVDTALAITRAEPPGMGFGITVRSIDNGADPQLQLLARAGRSQPDATAGRPQ